MPCRLEVSIYNEASVLTDVVTVVVMIICNLMETGSAEEYHTISVMVKDKAVVLKHDSTLTPLSEANGESVWGCTV